MKRVSMLIVATICLTLPAMAQRGGDEGDRGRGRDRARRERPGRPRIEADGPMKLLRRLPQRLELTEEQTEQFQTIVESFREKWDGAGGGKEKMNDLREKYRDARRSGDKEKAEKLQEQMRAAVGSREKIMGEFLDEVEGILNEDQVTKLDELRRRFDRSGRERDRGLRALIQRLPQEIELTEEQHAAWEEIMEEHREAVRTLGERYRELRPLRQKLREARQAQDEQLAAEIQAQIDAETPERPDPQQLVKKIEGILTDEQKGQFEELKKSIADEGGRKRGQMDVRRVFLAATRLDLSEEQTERLREIRQEAMRLSREAGRSPEAKAQVAEQVKAMIVEMLDANQANQFNQQLERGQRRGGDRDRDGGDRGPRRGRHGDRGPRPGRES